MTTDELVALYRSADSVPPLPALDGLDQVDWPALEDAYGPATGVPALLRALTSEVPNHRKVAAAMLCQQIWHQGDVYEATAAAVPFLYALLETEGPHDKTRITDLLATIALSRPPFAHCEEDPEAAAEWRDILSKSGRSLDAEMAEGRRYGAEIRRQLALRLDLLVPYLRDPEASLRVHIACTLAEFPEQSKRFLPDLKAALRDETNDWARGVLREAIDRLK